MEESKLRQNLKFRQDFPFFQPIPVQPLGLVTFEAAPGSAPDTAGSHFLTLPWSCTCSLFHHQQPDHPYDFLLDKLDLDLSRGKPGDVCSSDVDGETNQADHQTGRS